MTSFTFTRHGFTRQREVEAEAKLTWYTDIGYYRIQVCGYGVDNEAAEANAKLLMGQARAALVIATQVEEVLVKQVE
jgi:hypothetical protein